MQWSNVFASEPLSWPVPWWNHGQDKVHHQGRDVNLAFQLHDTIARCIHVSTREQFDSVLVWDGERVLIHEVYCNLLTIWREPLTPRQTLLFNKPWWRTISLFVNWIWISFQDVGLFLLSNMNIYHVMVKWSKVRLSSVRQLNFLVRNYGAWYNSRELLKKFNILRNLIL